MKQKPTITAALSASKAIGISLDSPDGKPLFTECALVADLGTNKLTLPQGYAWDGATIPSFCWSIVGVHPLDPRAVIASGFHDLGCESDSTPQVVADANFVALLGPIVFNGETLPGVGSMRATAMYLAVRLFSIFVRPTTRMFFRKES